MAVAFGLVLAWLAAPALPAAAQGSAPSAGRFLVASRQLSDPNFAHTVVLLLEHGAEGAVGLVVNRPTEIRASSLLPGIEGLAGASHPVYFGGPVARTHILLLIRSSETPEESEPVLEGVHVSSSRALLERLAAHPKTGESFRVYAGYAGWGPGQLEAEITRGGWFVVPGNADGVFNDAPIEIWRRLVGRGELPWARLQRPTLSTTAAGR